MTNTNTNLNPSANAAQQPDAVQVPGLPANLPFNSDQQHWLAGFMAGLHNRLLVNEQSAVAVAPAAAVQQKPLTIIYGSQTGNAESMAELAAEQASAHGMLASVKDMDDVSLAELAQAERLLVVTSTYGEGEMPDNAQMLWDAISSDDAPSFANTFFSVLALGDTSYDGFCVAGQLWDRRLEQLGGQRVADRVDCDVDFEAPAQSWIDAVLPEISSRGDQAAAAVSIASEAPLKAKSKFNRQNPLQAVLSRKAVLTGDASSKQICHFEFNLGDSGEHYDAGDALNLIPHNRADLVDELLQLLNSNAEQSVNGQPLRTLLTEQLEIRTPSKELLARLAQAEGAEAAKLKQLLDSDDNEPLNDYLWGKDVVDLLTLIPANLDGDEFVSLSKPLAPRAYSISSSINKHANEVHLTIGSVRYHSNGRDHNGVCSTWLADELDEGAKVSCYFAPNKHFALPQDDNLPIIMVGPGTGIAPFRSFLEEREMREAQGDNWLFFGDRNAASDFIYREELEGWQQSGLLTRLDLAFSRDQAEKIYVQDRMLEHGKELFEWFERGAYFYICGDAYRMAKDVDAALHQLVAEHGGFSEADAVAYVNNLKSQKRYVRDVY